MKDQHTKIKGCRDLSQVEIDLMNEIESAGQAFKDLLTRVYDHLEEQSANASLYTGSEGSDERTRIKAAEPGRWAAIARTHFQEGLMALTRSVSQPASF